MTRRLSCHLAGGFRTDQGHQGDGKFGAAGPTRSEGVIDFLKSIASNPRGHPSRSKQSFFARGRPSSLLQRMIEPEEIANLVAYVASPLSSATNGAAPLRVRWRRHAYNQLGADRCDG